MSDTRCASVGVLIKYTNEVLLCKRNAEAATLPNYWSVPAGRVEVGERLVHAALRELYEETRILLTEEQLERLGVHKDFGLFYHVSHLRYYPVLDIEHVGYAYFKKEELPFPMDSHLRDQIKYLL
jgi:8-oxo-dGTP pyrophosphatase MutT (NUDIX family)